MTRASNSLRRRRERLAYSQAALAHKVGVTERTIRQWEKGQRVPQIGNRRPLGDALGLNLDELGDLVAEIEADNARAAAGATSRSHPPDDASPSRNGWIADVESGLRPLLDGEGSAPRGRRG
jgi:DNA-binding XRE family transcriptional regulator